LKIEFSILYVNMYYNIISLVCTSTYIVIWTYYGNLCLWGGKGNSEIRHCCTI